MLDLIIKNGQCYINGKLEERDIAVKDGKIIKIGEVSEEAKEVYDAKNQLASCPFEIEGLPGSEGGYTFTIRNFLSTAKMGNLDVELKKDRASAQGGKIAFSITSKIAKLSAGRRSFSTLNKKRKELWQKYTPPGMKGPTKGVFWKHTVSPKHNFTDWRVFDSLHKEHTKQMNLKKSSKRNLDREQLIEIYGGVLPIWRFDNNGFGTNSEGEGFMWSLTGDQYLLEDSTGVYSGIFSIDRISFEVIFEFLVDLDSFTLDVSTSPRSSLSNIF